MGIICIRGITLSNLFDGRGGEDLYDGFFFRELATLLGVIDDFNMFGGIVFDNSEALKGIEIVFR
tara:strand:- start:285 stop:479 length:195 start_codon:yes stop_codon:yes gene_type:complete